MEPYRFDLSTRTDREQTYLEQLEQHLEASDFSRVEQAQNFAMYTPRQDLTRFLCRYEVFKRVLNVHGSIVECGCLFGGGVMAWAQLSAIFEPYNHQRRVVGFDTFAGHMGVERHEWHANAEAKEGGHAVDSHEEILRSAKLADMNRPVGHVPKVELVRGDACETIPQWIQDNPHALISLLYLDFDIYAPTVAALKHFMPRLVSGALVCFDEANLKAWPGETLAFIEQCRRQKLERFPWGSTMSFYEVR
jgi:hypothetical protein